MSVWGATDADFQDQEILRIADPRTPANAVHVDVRGMIFPSIKACSEALGVCYASALRAVDNGTTAFLGLDYQPRSKPTEWNGNLYPTIMEAAKSAGLSVRQFGYRRRKGQI
jgi:hypothetical protein